MKEDITNCQPPRAPCRARQGSKGTPAPARAQARGLNVWLKQIVLVLAPNVWLSTFLYFAAALIAYEALFFPLSYYSGYVLPHRYGLSTQALRAWLVDVAKGGALGIVLGGLVIEVIYALLRGDLPLPLLSAGEPEGGIPCSPRGEPAGAGGCGRARL